MPNVTARKAPSRGVGFAGKIESGDELLRRNGTKRFLAHSCELVPIELAIESDPNPAPSSYVGWAEEPIGFAGDELRLRTGWSGAPQVWEVIVMVAVRPEHQELLAGKERRGPMAGSLCRSGQSSADGADAILQHRRAHRATLAR